MEVQSVGAVVQNNSQLDRAGLNQEDFLEVLLTQLTFQDPLEPMDNQEFIAQIAQFTTLEQTRQTNEQLTSLLSVQSTNQSLSLLNKTVEATVNGTVEIGEVTTITFDQGIPSFTLQKADNSSILGVSLSQIRIVR